MDCHNNYCIYNENFNCTAQEIKINEAGLCDCCIMPNFPQKVLEKYKHKTLVKLEDEQ